MPNAWTNLEAEALETQAKALARGRSVRHAQFARPILAQKA